MRNPKESPCENCRRVPDPRQCENKDCKIWRRWFVSRWEQMRRMYRPDEDPCVSCRCPEELCFDKCSRKEEWDTKRKESV